MDGRGRARPGKITVALMIDIGLGEAPQSGGAAGDWRLRLDEWARQMFSRFWRHPWALEATVGPRAVGQFSLIPGLRESVSLRGPARPVRSPRPRPRPGPRRSAVSAAAGTPGYRPRMCTARLPSPRASSRRRP